MKNAAKSPERLEPGDWARWIRVGIPLLAGIVLLAVSAILMVRLQGDAGKVDSPAAGGTLQEFIRKNVIEEPPVPQAKGPELIEQRPAPRPPGEGLKRWSLDHIPEEWNEELALKIAGFFDAMFAAVQSDGDQGPRLEELREALAAYLASLGPEAIPTLSAILGSEVDFVNRRFLITALGNLGPLAEEATYALLELYSKSREQYLARTEMGHVIDAMGSLKNETAYNEITKAIDDPGTQAWYRDKFIQALGDHPRAAEAVPGIVNVLETDQDPSCRNHAAQYLGKVRKPEAIDPLISAYEKEQRYFMVRQTILGSLGKIGDERPIPFLFRVATTGDPSGVRLSASRALFLIRTPKSLKTLREVLQYERDEKIRSSILEWLGEAGPQGK